MGKQIFPGAVIGERGERVAIVLPVYRRYERLEPLVPSLAANVTTAILLGKGRSCSGWYVLVDASLVAVVLLFDA